MNDADRRAGRRWCWPFRARSRRAARDRPSNAAAITARQERVRAWWTDPKNQARPEDLVGLALSGGGIRSATFSLGVLQALAGAGRLGCVDVMSTVSGGSYIGCFLRGLFMPQRYRGIDRSPPVQPGAAPLCQEECAAQHRFAMAALCGSPAVKVLKGPDGLDVCNPLWWLREHSRYLAPNGPSDYGTAAAYLVRNWLSMLFVFAVAAALVLTLSAGAEVLAAIMAPSFTAWVRQLQAGLPADLARADVGAVWTSAVAQHPWMQLLSPMVALAGLPLLISFGLGVAYWLTAQMSVNERDERRQWMWFDRMALAGAAITALLGAILATQTWFSSTTARIEPNATAGIGVLFGLCLLALTSGLLFYAAARRRVTPPVLLTANLRSWLTDTTAWFNGVALWLAALGVVESAGEYLRQRYWSQQLWTAKGSVGALLVLIAPYLTNKLPQWFGAKGAGGRWWGALQRGLPALALVLGAVLYGAVAAIVAALVQAAAWDRKAWFSPPDPHTFAAEALVVIALGVLVGRSSGFINLSSLHNLYATRLIRAYLGAGNTTRLRTIADPTQADVAITDNHPEDYIQPELYGRLVIPAPLHLINVTLNCTIDLHSQLVARDRKGDIVSLGPEGVIIGGGRRETLLPWSGIGGGGRRAQSLSLGQWCAISGAAASTGMGRMTHLGYALLMSFANARLGYWWYAPAIGRGDASPLPRSDALRRSMLRARSYLFRTFVYLGNEMTARYSRVWERKYLSDGGHFENTGAYALLRRDVPLILLCDNAQDPDFLFSDLENLVRLARLDLRRELRLLGGADLARLAAGVGAAPDAFIDPEREPDWRARLKAGTATGLALAFEATRADGAITSHLLVVKPHLLDHLPEDVLGYARAHADFPQQSTGEQFFDEAQWESYRRLGQLTMERLLQRAPGLL